MDATSPIAEPRRSFSIKLWPPSQNTRLMLVERVTNNLSSESIFAQKYGCLSKEEATENAQKIEDSAFLKADKHYQKEADGDGSAAVQLYAKECGKLILETLKNGPQVKVNRDVLEVEKEVTRPRKNVFDISKGQRALIEADEAEELLKPLMEPGNSYTKICFSNKSFGLGAARAAKPILESLKNQLQEVELSNFVAERPEVEALEVMNIFSAALEGCVLRSLNLSDNALGEKGVRAFERLLKSQVSLEELYLMNDGITEEAAQAVCELVPSTDKLKVLQFHNTGDGAIAISEIVRRSPLLNNFRCSSTGVGPEGGSALGEALGLCIHMKKLDLRDNKYGVEAGIMLSKALLKHSNLTELYLSYLNLKDEGVIAIANALKETAPPLEVLEMAGNDITIAAVPCLAACIAEKKVLNKLNLAGNKLKDEGVIQISKALEDRHDCLKEVDMSTNSVRRAGARALAQAVVGLPEFKLLNLNGNFISEEGIDELKSIFKKSPDMLGSLDVNDPEGGDDEVKDEKESGDEGEGDEDELESKLKNLDVNLDAD